MKPVGEDVQLFFPYPKSKRRGITPCMIKPAATYAAATDQFHSPDASADA